MEQFYKELEKLQPRRADIQKARSELKNVMLTFSSSIEKSNVKVKSESFATNIANFQKNVKDKIEKLMEEFAAQEKNEAFQSDLKNSFIVIIYGKVKAGKSTLGNFVARNKLPSQMISFEFYDKDGNKKVSNSLEQFKTDIVECTASIQLFKLGAMAWVDTPGLSSMTEENGNLARQYIDNADFVIFPTSSDSPLQQDEIEQIKELKEKRNKKFSVFITKSDMQEEDEINGKIIKILKNKDEENRRKQNEDVRKRLIGEVDIDENILGEIISFSVITAEKGKEENDDKLYKESNIEKFYDLLTQSVLSKAEKLKSEAPLAGLVGLISSILNDPNGEMSNINSGLKELEIKSNEIIKKTNTIKGKLKVDFSSAISDVIAQNENTLNAANSREIFKKMKKEIDEKISSITEKEIKQILSEFDQSIFSVLGLSEDDIQIENKYVPGLKKKNRSWGSTFAGAVVGTIGGFVVGGPVGATIGATVGAGIGDKLGSSTEEKRIRVGDNKHEVLGNFRSKNINYYTTDYIADIEKNLNDDLVLPMNTIINHYNKQIDDFKQNLEQLKTKYSQGK